MKKAAKTKTADKSKAATPETPKTQDEILNQTPIQRRIKRRADGLFEVAGKYYKKLVGSRDEVYNGVAYKTNYNSNALTRDDLALNPKTRKIVSKSKQEWCKGSGNVLRKMRVLGKLGNIKNRKRNGTKRAARN
jgi:hypothetical protein